MFFDSIIQIILEKLPKSEHNQLIESLIELFELITSLTYKDPEGNMLCGNIKFSQEARKHIEDAHLK